MNKSQLKFLFFMLILTAAMPLFAAGGGGDLGSLGLGNLEGFVESLKGIFTSGIVRAILIMCLCGCAIAYGFNKDNEKMKRNIIAIAIAIAILVAAQSIVDALFDKIS